MGHVGSHVLLEDDQIFLHHGEHVFHHSKLSVSCYTRSARHTHSLLAVLCFLQRVMAFWRSYVRGVAETC